MWEQIRSNQLRSTILVAVLGALLLLLGYFLGLYFFESGPGGLVIAIIVYALMNLIAFAQGDSILLAMSGARKISPDDHPRLYNVVEEMKIASGLPKMPDIYIIDDTALNAFATGRDSNRASVAITSGLLAKLNRDELQGVIAHEMSHIKNRDVQLMVLASVLLGSIVIIAWYASRVFLFSGMSGGGGRRRSSSSEGNPIALIAVAATIILVILAPIIAQLIYFAISRKREYLADASSALYTRYPAGLASALEKLATSDTHVKSANQATAPMYTIDPFHRPAASVNDLMSTHPPIAERVRILRSMGGASYVDYEKAYQQVRKTGSLIPASAMSGAGTVSLRAPATEGAPVTDTKERVERHRETADLMWRLSNYKAITCSNCGTKVRLPPTFRESSVRCPHCGQVNPV